MPEFVVNDPEALEKAKRLVFFAHYDREDIVAPHVLWYLDGLRGAGFTIVFITTSRLPAAERDKVRFCAAFHERANDGGRDFSCWKDAFAAFGHLAPELLLLCNDSVYGPTSDLGRYIDDLTSVDADFYSPVGTSEFARHGQSWFLLLRPAAYRHPALVEFFRKLDGDAVLSKAQLIDELEVGLSQALMRGGLRLACGYEPSEAGEISAREPFNAAHLLWRQLIESGASPFLKVDLLRTNPARVRGLDAWRPTLMARCPELVPVVEADLARLGAPPRPAVKQGMDWVVRTAGSPAYWHLFRPFLERDFALTRAGDHRGARRNARRYFALRKLAQAPRLPVAAGLALARAARGAPPAGAQ